MTGSVRESARESACGVVDAVISKRAPARTDFRVDDGTDLPAREGGETRYINRGSRGCVLEVTDGRRMGMRRSLLLRLPLPLPPAPPPAPPLPPPPKKSEKNRSRCNCRSRGGRNRRNNYRAQAGRGVQYAILFGATVLVIASEAITCSPLPPLEKIRLVAAGEGREGGERGRDYITA